MTSEARTWRRLALAAAGTVGLLTVRVLADRPLIGRHPIQDLRREYRARVGDPGQPVDEDDLFSETWAQEHERRLRAVEVHLQNLPPERGA